MKVLLRKLFLSNISFSSIRVRCTSSLGSSPHNKVDDASPTDISHYDYDVFIIFIPLVFLTLSQSRRIFIRCIYFYSRFSSKVRSFDASKIYPPSPIGCVKNKLFSAIGCVKNKLFSVSINHLITKRNIMSHSSATTFVGRTYGRRGTCKQISCF